VSQDPPAPTQPPAGSDPRWPGPPSTWPGEPGAGPGTPGGGPAGPGGSGGPPGPGGPGPWGSPPSGSPDGPPPPPWKRKRQRWILGLGIAGAVLVLAVPVGFGFAALSRAASEIQLTGDGEVAGGDADDAPTSPRGEDVEVTPPDLDRLDGTDEVVARVLIDIDRSERAMMDTQSGFAEVLADPSTGDDVEAAFDELSATAGEGQRELQDLRRELTAPGEGSEVRAVRDRYLAHLDAWVRYLVAIEQDPTLLVGGADDEAFIVAIDTTGDAFAREVREGLPEGLDEEVRDFALAIVDRGFADRQPDIDDTV
jgi:hypothetical protein